MKIRFGLIAAVMSACLGTCLFAQPPEGRPGREGEGRPGERLRERLGNPNGPGRPGGAEGGRPALGDGSMLLRALPLMTALDADGDGTISATEIENASNALLKLDRDGDGKLSTEELRPDPSKMMGMLGGPGGPGGAGGPAGMLNGQMTPQMAERMFDTRDADKDGLLKGEEIPERMRERARMIDENGDGGISKQELKAAMERMGQAGGRRPERAGDEGGGVQPRRPPSDN